MTAQEFKKDYPEYAHLEGDELFDTMTIALNRQQAGEEILKSIQPFYKRYKLRYLHYRKQPAFIFSPAWDSETVCKNCGYGTNSYMLWGGRFVCLKCKEVLIHIPNKKWSYLFRKNCQKITTLFWKALDFLHLVRYGHEGRYGSFSDERRYVEKYTIDMGTGKTTITFKKRRWFEYIFIKK